jgi:hypothetical protein
MSTELYLQFCYKTADRVLDFGFKCGTPTHRDGLSVPLLSVSIAGLMAIFLDSSLAAQVNLSSLSVVIYQASASLLDQRLSSSSSTETSGLDTSTCKKMVKAINKVRMVPYNYLLLVRLRCFSNLIL